MEEGVKHDEKFKNFSTKITVLCWKVFNWKENRNKQESKMIKKVSEYA